jgi:hypothetical protein
MMVWGGYVWGINTNPGGLYTPATDSWKTMSVVGAPSGRQNAEAVWTGSEAIFWGGSETEPGIGTGGRYDPVADTWADVSLDNAPNERWGHSATWTGSEMIVFGGVGADPPTTAKRYHPTTDTWTDATTLNAPGVRDHHAAVWTGTEMIIWGGAIGEARPRGALRPATDTWRPTNVADSPPAQLARRRVDGHGDGGLGRLRLVVLLLPGRRRALRPRLRQLDGDQPGRRAQSARHAGSMDRARAGALGRRQRLQRRPLQPRDRLVAADHVDERT